MYKLILFGSFAIYASLMGYLYIFKTDTFLKMILGYLIFKSLVFF